MSRTVRYTVVVFSNFLGVLLNGTGADAAAFRGISMLFAVEIVELRVLLRRLSDVVLMRR